MITSVMHKEAKREFSKVLLGLVASVYRRTANEKRHKDLFRVFKRKIKRSNSYVMEKLPPRKELTLAEQFITFENPKTEVFLLKNMNPKALHHMILRLVAEKLNIGTDDNTLTRRYSDELKMAGGKIKKLNSTFETPTIDLLRQHYSEKALKSGTQVNFPWFLDTNMNSLEDSLKCFRLIIAKYACAMEKVIYKNYTVLPVNLVVETQLNTISALFAQGSGVATRR